MPVTMQGKRRLICHVLSAFYPIQPRSIQFRIEFKVIVITFKAIHGLAPDYISNLIKITDYSKQTLSMEDKMTAGA